MRPAAVFALVLALVGCEKTASEKRATTTTSCASTLASYDALVAAGGACTTNADCECFNGGVSPKTPCGGVTDKATATKLGALITDYEAAHCSSLMCAAFTCKPACNAGRCTNGASM
ncbi:MAG TPA: hypothetical protein VGH87_03275 [Polyangiaceae bacterium]|jgi:hypothetical protein|nr:hypothetical protein [Polyangiaceae bacterium]